MSQVINPIATIGKGCLTDAGAFDCHIYFKFWNPIGNNWVNTSMGSTMRQNTNDCEDPGVLGAPPNSVVRLCVDVVAGDNAFGQEQFTYVPGNANRCNYSISGTTLDNSLGYKGITTAQSGT